MVIAFYIKFFLKQNLFFSRIENNGSVGALGRTKNNIIMLIVDKHVAEGPYFFKIYVFLQFWKKTNIAKS